MSKYRTGYAVYTASKLRHAPMWQELARAWPEIYWTARWPFHHVGQTPDHQTFASVFWEHDLEDVLRSDAVLVYAEPDDKLRGALVEAGMALASGLRVVVVGEHPDYSTWQYHPRVHRVPNLEATRVLFKTLATRPTWEMPK